MSSKLTDTASRINYMTLRTFIALSSADTWHTDALTSLHIAVLMPWARWITCARFTRDHHQRIAIVTSGATLAQLTRITRQTFANVLTMGTNGIAGLRIAATNRVSEWGKGVILSKEVTFTWPFRLGIGIARKECLWPGRQCIPRHRLRSELRRYYPHSLGRNRFVDRILLPFHCTHNPTHRHPQTQSLALMK